SVFEGRMTRSMSEGSSSARAASDRTASSTVPGCSMTACIHLWTRGRPRSGGRGNPVLLEPVGARLQGLAVDDVEGRNVGVPLEQRRDVAGPLYRSLV